MSNWGEDWDVPGSGYGYDFPPADYVPPAQPPPGYPPPGSHYAPYSANPPRGPYLYPPAAWAPPRNSDDAVVALILSICSFAVVPLIPAVAALILANIAERKIAGSGGRLTGWGLCRTARIIAVINLALCAFAVLLICLGVALG